MAAALAPPVYYCVPVVAGGVLPRHPKSLARPAPDGHYRHSKWFLRLGALLGYDKTFWAIVVSADRRVIDDRLATADGYDSLEQAADAADHHVADDLKAACKFYGRA